MATAKNQAIDELRRRQMLDRKHEELGRQALTEASLTASEIETAIDEDVGDDLLRLVLI